MEQKSRRQPQKRTSSTSVCRKETLIKPLSILFLMIALCVGAYWNINDTSSSKHVADEKMTQIEGGRASGKNMDYTEASKELQDAVDTWMKSQGAAITVIDTAKREENRRATHGKIFWTTNRMQVIPKETFSRSSLEKELAISGDKAVLYNVGKTNFNGTEVTEYDIALFDMLDKEQLYLVVEKLYVTAPGTSVGIIEKIKTVIAGSKSGIVKKSSEDKTDNSSSPQTHPNTIKGRLAIVIDDCGSRTDVIYTLNTLSIPLTYAVMPYKPYTTLSANLGYAAGRQIFVHMPMQPLNVPSSETVYIGTHMSDSKIKTTVNELLDQVPHAIGMNNHQGSGATADSRVMKAVMEVMKQRGLIYLDSRTNSASIGAQTAASMGIATGRNSLFLDNDADVESVKKRIRQAGHIAVNNGSCIVIGHCRPNTAEAIAEMIDELHDEGVDIVFASELMQ